MSPTHHVNQSSKGNPTSDSTQEFIATIAKQVAQVITNVIQHLQPPTIPNVLVEPKTTKTPAPNVNNKKRKSHNRNFAVVTPVNQVPMNLDPTPQKKPYIGTYPLCNTCQYHHSNNIPCRKCTSCGRYGHFANICRNPRQPQTTQAPPQNRNPPAITNGRACYRCGDPNHISPQCPQTNRNLNQNPRPRNRVSNINTTQDQPKNDIGKSMFSPL